jgi:hypothetical protein
LRTALNAVRAVLPVWEFDANAAAEGIKTLKAYGKDWDEERGAWRNKPRHDFSSQSHATISPPTAPTDSGRVWPSLIARCCRRRSRSHSR